MNPIRASLLVASCLILCPAAFAASEGFHLEAEAGVVLSTGNADSQSFNFKQQSTYGFDVNLFKFFGKFLSTSASGVETARSWNLGARYERSLASNFSLFAGQALESDIFSGVIQRYNTDAGGKYFFVKEEAFDWSAEAGYRLSVENRYAGQVSQNYLRFYSEANRAWTKTFTTRLSVEYLPNLTQNTDYQLNGELSGNAAISELFAIKVGYLLKYRNVPVAPATRTTDTQLTTALVAKL